MAKTVDLDAMASASAALGAYIQRVALTMRQMGHAAQDCADNMGNGKISREAIYKVQTCVQSLEVNLREAQDIKDQIDAKMRQIEGSF